MGLSWTLGRTKQMEIPVSVPKKKKSMRADGMEYPILLLLIGDPEWISMLVIKRCNRKR